MGPGTAVFYVSAACTRGRKTRRTEKYHSHRQNKFKATGLLKLALVRLEEWAQKEEAV
jgi:lipid II:glycine glycyltransferase (peptidoglycan interpeptide bridge formation enzyme)